MKKVVITQRIDEFSIYSECRDGIDQRLCRWLLSAGYLPVPIPNVLQINKKVDVELNYWLEAISPHAVLLSGGNDIGERRARDDIERSLLTWAEIHRIPVLGICRGMQMMSVWAKGELKPVLGHVQSTHKLNGIITGEANSYHNYSLSSCPFGFENLAVAEEDGEIEAIRHTSLPWEGWMWHPEREEKFCYRDLARVRRLFGS